MDCCANNNISNRVNISCYEISCEIDNTCFWLQFRAHNSLTFASSNVCSKNSNKAHDNLAYIPTNVLQRKRHCSDALARRPRHKDWVSYTLARLKWAMSKHPTKLKSIFSTSRIKDFFLQSTPTLRTFSNSYAQELKSGRIRITKSYSQYYGLPLLRTRNCVPEGVLYSRSWL